MSREVFSVSQASLQEEGGGCGSEARRISARIARSGVMANRWRHRLRLAGMASWRGERAG